MTSCASPHEIIHTRRCRAETGDDDDLDRPLHDHLGRLSRRRQPRARTASTSKRATSTTSTPGGASTRNPFRDLQDDGKSRNWDNDRRIAELDADGVVAEVIFPNTVPPFFPTGVVIARPPTPEHVRAAPRRHPGPQPLAGRLVRRHPQRRAGLAQIFLNDVDDAIAESKWVPSRPAGRHPRPPACRPTHRASSRSTPTPTTRCGRCARTSTCRSTSTRAARACPTTGDTAPRPLIWMIRGPVLRRPGVPHDAVRRVRAVPATSSYILTEVGAGWVLATLPQLDLYHKSLVETGRVGELGFESDVILPLSPSDASRPQLLAGRELRRAGRRRAHPRDLAPTASCGAATTPMTRGPTRTRTEALQKRVRRHRPRTTSR